MCVELKGNFQSKKLVLKRCIEIQFGSFSGIIECKEPIEVVSYKIGVCKVSPKGKDCVTIFQKLGYDGKTSIVSCKPKTGRMHQIRVHLQYLGKKFMLVYQNYSYIYLF